MSSSEHKGFDAEDGFFQTFASDFARLASGFATVLAEGREDIEDWYWAHLDKRLSKMDLPTPEDWEALLLMMKRLRQINKDLAKRIEILEKRGKKVSSKK